jgi:hypothetical protein
LCFKGRTQIGGFGWFGGVWALISCFGRVKGSKRGVFDGSRGSLLRVLKVVRVWAVWAGLEGFWTVLGSRGSLLRCLGRFRDPREVVLRVRGVLASLFRRF